MIVESKLEVLLSKDDLKRKIKSQAIRLGYGTDGRLTEVTNFVLNNVLVKARRSFREPFDPLLYTPNLTGFDVMLSTKDKTIQIPSYDPEDYLIFCTRQSLSKLLFESKLSFRVRKSVRFTEIETENLPSSNSRTLNFKHLF